MKVYTAVTAATLPKYADHLRAMMWSASHVAKLEPHFLFDGDLAIARALLGDGDYHLHRVTTSIGAAIDATPEALGWSRAIAKGALLRLEIPKIEQEDGFVLYTDCDVIFTRRVDLGKLAPRFIAAAPGHNAMEWSDICSGVILLNVETLRREHAALMSHAANTLGRPHFYDQEVINAYFHGRIDRLPLEYHWKTYWGLNPFARIVHFHGPKRPEIAAVGAHALVTTDVYAFLFMEQSGLASYARLMDAMVAGRAAAPFRAFGFAPNEILRFLAQKSLGQLRKWQSVGNAAINEGRYLYANPDVAIAVYNGWMPSGRWHFARYGRTDNRGGTEPSAFNAEDASS